MEKGGCQGNKWRSTRKRATVAILTVTNAVSDHSNLFWDFLCHLSKYLPNYFNFLVDPSTEGQWRVNQFRLTPEHVDPVNDPGQWQHWTFRSISRLHEVLSNRVHTLLYTNAGLSCDYTQTQCRCTSWISKYAFSFPLFPELSSCHTWLSYMYSNEALWGRWWQLNKAYWIARGNCHLEGW